MPLKVQWPHWDVGRSPLYWNIASKLTMAAVGTISKFFMGYFNTKRIYNINNLYTAINNRAPNQGLVTFSNHHSCLDEPLLWSILTWKHFSTQIDCMRWTTGAADVCFNKEWHSALFSLGRTIPLVRGDGVQQNSINFALQLLNAGKWVHIYPEGKVTREDVRLKWGIGRMMAEASTPPLLLGFYHLGMDDILPNIRPYRLHTGKKITVVVGDPVDVGGVLRGVEAGRRNVLTETGSRMVVGGGKEVGNVVVGGVDEGEDDEDVRVVKRLKVTQLVQQELNKLKTIASDLHHCFDRSALGREDERKPHTKTSNNNLTRPSLSYHRNSLLRDKPRDVANDLKKEEMGEVEKIKDFMDEEMGLDESDKHGEALRRVEGKK